MMIRETGIHKTTFCKILFQHRSLIFHWHLENSLMIGGPGYVVEIDESDFRKRKYNQGRLILTKWIIGGILVDCFFFLT